MKLTLLLLSHPQIGALEVQPVQHRLWRNIINSILAWCINNRRNWVSCVQGWRKDGWDFTATDHFLWYNRWWLQWRRFDHSFQLCDGCRKYLTVTLTTQSWAMEDVVVVVYYGSEQVRPSQFTDWKLLWNWEICTCAGGVRFSSAYHSRSQVVQIQQGARDDQQSHYSAEGGGLGGCRTQGFVWHWTDNEHTSEKGKDRNRGKSSCYCERAQDFDGKFGSESDETLRQVSHQLDEHEDMQGELQLMKDLEMYERILHTDVPSGKKIWSTRRCHRYMGTGVRPDSWSDSPVTQIGKQLFPMYQDSWLCVFFFARYRIHQADHWSWERQSVRLEIAEGAQWSAVDDRWR